MVGIISIICGAAIWFFSPIVTLKIEPWDNPLYYSAALVCTGFIIGKLLKPPAHWKPAAWMVVGQLAYALIFMEKGSLLPLGVVAMALFSLLAFFGTLMAEHFPPHRSC